MTDALDPAYEECERLVRGGDPDRFLALPFAPDRARRHLAALYAFNIETARVREQVSQPMPGEIRLQWWRDHVAAAKTSRGDGHPVAMALLDTIRRFDLPYAAFDRFIDARIFDLYDDPMPDREAFETYAGETASALIMLAAMVIDRETAPEISDPAGHAGVAQAVAGALRLLPFHRRRGQVYIPQDILSATGCSAEALIRGDRESSERAIAAMTAFGREHFAAFSRAADAIAKPLRAAFLPAALGKPYFDRIEKAGAANLERPVEISPLKRSFAYWRTMRM